MTFWIRGALGGVLVALSVAVAGCAIQATDSSPEETEAIGSVEEDLTTQPVTSDVSTPGDDVEEGEGEEPSPNPWKARSTSEYGPSSPDPDPGPYEAQAVETNSPDDSRR